MDKVNGFKYRTVALALLAGLMLSACSGGRGKNEQGVAPLPVKVLTVGGQTSVVTHTYVGTIEEEKRVPLSMETGGQVVEVGCRVGGQVKTGDVLLRVDSATAVDAREVADAALRQAEDGYRRVAEVYGAGGVTAQQLVEVETKRAQARSMASLAARRVEGCTLTSPCEAVVGDVSAVVGQTVVSSVPVVALLIINRLYVSFSVPEDEIAAIRIGDTGVAEVPAAETGSVGIKVVEKGMKAHALSHTYTVRAEVTEKGDLLPGMVSKVRMDGQRRDGIVVPAVCVQVAPDGHYLWAAKADGTAEKQYITVGEYLPGGVLVTGGLQAGDKVITDGFQKLYKGCRIVY